MTHPFANLDRHIRVHKVPPSWSMLKQQAVELMASFPGIAGINSSGFTNCDGTVRQVGCDFVKRCNEVGC